MDRGDTAAHDKPAQNMAMALVIIAGRIIVLSSERTKVRDGQKNAECFEE